MSLQPAAPANVDDEASDNEPSAKRHCPSAPIVDLVSSDAVENRNKSSKMEQEGKAGCHGDGDTPTVTSTASEQ